MCATVSDKRNSKLDAYAAAMGNTRASSNTGQLASLLIELNGLPLIWDSTSWKTVNWDDERARRNTRK